MNTHNLCFGQTYEKHQNFLSENFPFFLFFFFFFVKFSVYLNRCVFVMKKCLIWSYVIIMII